MGQGAPILPTPFSDSDGALNQRQQSFTFQVGDGKQVSYRHAAILTRRDSAPGTKWETIGEIEAQPYVTDPSACSRGTTILHISLRMMPRCRSTMLIPA